MISQLIHIAIVLRRIEYIHYKDDIDMRDVFKTDNDKIEVVGALGICYLNDKLIEPGELLQKIIDAEI